VFTPTITFTPVIPPAPKTFQILDTSIYPNPYNPATGDLNARVNLTNAAQKFILRVYTVSFRKVMEEEENPGPYSSGTQTINVPAARFSRLASGTYYYRIEGESTAGGKAASAADKFVIIR
jgi:hypothetical protein